MSRHWNIMILTGVSKESLKHEWIFFWSTMHKALVFTYKPMNISIPQDKCKNTFIELNPTHRSAYMLHYILFHKLTRNIYIHQMITHTLHKSISNNKIHKCEHTRINTIWFSLVITLTNVVSIPSTEYAHFIKFWLHNFDHKKLVSHI